LAALETAVKVADVLVLLVDHSQFQDVPSRFDLSALIVIDTRGQWD
jgi:UDP-N-acetyl-D-mannosaminuronate dehydrogenase